MADNVGKKRGRDINKDTTNSRSCDALSTSSNTRSTTKKPRLDDTSEGQLIKTHEFCFPQNPFA